MVVVGTGTASTKIVKTNWPITEGLTAGTTKLAAQAALIPETSVVRKDIQEGL